MDYQISQITESVKEFTEKGNFYLKKAKQGNQCGHQQAVEV